jgi:hypothetical protein
MPSNFADRPQSGPYLFRYNFKSAAKRPSIYRYIRYDHGRNPATPLGTPRALILALWL